MTLTKFEKKGLLRKKFEKKGLLRKKFEKFIQNELGIFGVEFMEKVYPKELQSFEEISEIMASDISEYVEIRIDRTHYILQKFLHSFKICKGVSINSNSYFKSVCFYSFETYIASWKRIKFCILDSSEFKEIKELRKSYSRWVSSKKEAPWYLNWKCLD